MRGVFQIVKVSLVAMIVLSFVVGCSSKSNSRSRGVSSEVISADLVSESDSLAYIIGVSLAEQIYKLDSTVNISVLCRGIMEQFEGDAVMNPSYAREEYMRYLLAIAPERRRSYEEQFLTDLAAKNRDFTRAKSGLTYHISVIGDESLTPKGSNDWVTLRYSISRIDGSSVVANKTESFAISELMSGLEESVKMIGKGGKIDAWLPSKIAYGEDGDKELEIESAETLFYEIEMVDVERNAAAERRKERDIANF